jgi:hypothetical protein
MDLQDTPEEALDASSKESPISHRLTRTRQGWEWRQSRFMLFLGTVFMAMAVGWHVLFSHVDSGSLLHYAGLAISGGCCLLCWVAYAYGRFMGLRVNFDLAHDEVAVSQKRKIVERFSLRELAAIQTCYRYEGGSCVDAQNTPARQSRTYRWMESSLAGRFHEGKPLQDDNFQVVLVRRERNGNFERRLIVSTLGGGEARALAKRTAEALGVGFLDCATPDHVKRVRAEWLRLGGSLPRPQRKGVF